MAGFVWKEEFSVGVPSIDEQHKKFITMIEVHASDQEASKVSFQENLVKSLGEYAKQHFDYEESLLKENGYPEKDLHEHVSEHEKLLFEINDYKLRIDQGFSVSILELYQFLTFWIIHHLLDSDHKYANFLQEKGVQ